MRIYTEFDLHTFEAWQGAKETRNAIIEAGKAEEFNDLVDELFPDGLSETEMNDFLWFDDETIFEMLDI